MNQKKRVTTTVTSNKFSVVFTSLITPFYKGRIDFVSLKKLVAYQMNRGVSGFVVNGTTAESPNLSESEVEKIFRSIKRASGGKCPLILGCGTNSTSSTLIKCKKAKSLGADAVLVVVPYYNKPPQRGLVEHFKEVARSSKLPVLLYNVPGRTVVSLTPSSVIALSKVRNIVGIKEASGSMRDLNEIQAGTKKDFLLTSGDDGTCVDFVGAGGHGVISVVSHIIPGELSELIQKSRSGDSSVVKLYKKYDNLNALMGVEANPIPVKLALYKMSLIRSPELRLPLVSLEKQKTLALVEELRRLKII